MRALKLLGLLAFALTACSVAPTAPAADAEDDYVVVSEEAVAPYPNAVAVRLFVTRPYAEMQDGRGDYVDADGALLTSKQRRDFEATLIKRTFRGGSANACFIPHHFFRYYDAAGALVGELEVCFCCAGVRDSPGLFDYEATVDGRRVFRILAFSDALEPLIQSWGYRTDIDC